MCADILVADSILARVVRVAVGEPEVDGRAVVFPRDEEFFFLFRVEAVGVDVVDARADFEQEPRLDCVLLERVGKYNGEPDFRLELAFAEYGKVGRVLVEGEHRDEQRDSRDGLVVLLGACKFAFFEFDVLFYAG